MVVAAHAKDRGNPPTATPCFKGVVPQLVGTTTFFYFRKVGVAHAKQGPGKPSPAPLLGQLLVHNKEVAVVHFCEIPIK